MKSANQIINNIFGEMLCILTKCLLLIRNTQKKLDKKRRSEFTERRQYVGLFTARGHTACVRRARQTAHRNGTGRRFRWAGNNRCV